MARRQAPHACEQRVGARWSAIREVIRQRLVIQLRRCRLRCEQRLDLRCEVERSIVRLHVIQRLLSQPIPRQEQLLPATVPDGEREHSPEEIDRARTLILIQPEDRLGVTPRAIAMAAPLQAAAQFGMVVDLAVVHDVERAGVVVHGLMPARHVDDRQTAMCQSDAPLAEDAVIVRAPMGHRVPHPHENLGVHQPP
jgi:hypothetical protein